MSLRVGCHQRLASLPPRHCADKGRRLLLVVAVVRVKGVVGVCRGIAAREAMPDAGGVDVLQGNVPSRRDPRLTYKHKLYSLLFNLPSPMLAFVYLFQPAS
eukprot:1138204-Pelagomonas_calceolata.AAC.4